MENWGRFFCISLNNNAYAYKPQRSFGGLPFIVVLQSVCLSLVAKKVIFQIVDLVAL